MAFETREQILEKILQSEKPRCPNCGGEMSLWEVPPINFSDGLGWGAPFLYVCFNDACPLYQQGWDHMQETYNHRASYRCMCYPGSDSFEVMPVFSPEGGQGQIIDSQVMAEEEALKENTKKGFSILADCYVSKDTENVVRLLTDPTQPVRVRLKASEMVGDIGDLTVIDLLKSLRFGNERLQEMTDRSVHKIHERFFTRECPFCAEIIKQRAKICKHCGKEVAGI